jgi:hypothetical protein
MESKEQEAVVMVCWNGWIRGLVLLDLCPLIFLLAAPLMAQAAGPYIGISVLTRVLSRRCRAVPVVKWASRKLRWRKRFPAE